MPRKILLADDSVTIQKVVELTFSEGDYQVTCVSNGKMAVEQLNTNRPDIIICDIIMPEMSGYDVAELVKRNPSFQAIPVILLTGTFEPFDEERARKSGAEAYVTKPFDSKMLVDKVESLLAQKIQYAPVQAVAPATMVQGGSEYQLPGVVTDEAAKAMDAQIHTKPSIDSYDFPESPMIEGEIPTIAPPPSDAPSFESPVVEDLAIPADKGEPGDLKGFDAIMEPPAAEEVGAESILEATASSVPPAAQSFAVEVPPEAPAWQEPELPESPSQAGNVQVPDVVVETESPPELSAEPETSAPQAAEMVGERLEESAVPDLPETVEPEPEISIGEPETQAEEPPAQEMPEVPPASAAMPEFYEPPVFEAPPALESGVAAASFMEEPKGFMEIPEPEPPSQPVVPPEPSILVTDMNEQAMMVGEGQKKIDEEKSAKVAEEGFEEAAEYPVRKMEPEEIPAVPELEPVREEAEAAPEEPPAAAGTVPSEITVSPEMLEEIVRKVVAELAPSIVTGIAWEVIPELANSIIKKRIEDLEKEAE